MRLAWRGFAFPLVRPLRTARGELRERRGWLLRLETEDGRCGWGEAAPLEGDPRVLAAPLAALGPEPRHDDLERALPSLHPCLAFGLAAALAEIEGLVGPAAGGWRPAPEPAVLLPAGEAAALVLGELVERRAVAAPAAPLTLKWKVAAAQDALERRLLERLLGMLPAGWRLRLDANGGWDRSTASAWADRLAAEPRLEWLEQPLQPDDVEGLERLARRLPVALDESLALRPELRRSWRGWQVRRPSQDGDPRFLLAQLRRGTPRLVLSTGFETGIGRRWLDHLAALQQLGPTPAAPGLAPGWSGEGALHCRDPQRVWEAAAP